MPNNAAAGLMGFLQPTIDLSQRALGLPSDILQSQMEGPLTTLLGSQGGPLMANALANALGPMMAVPEGAMRTPVGMRGILGMPSAAYQESRYPRRGTTFLGESTPQFHGTPKAIETVRDPRMTTPSGQVSSEGNLYGPGFYTTDNYHVAGGYAGGSRGTRYTVHEVNPVKLLDMDKPMPKAILDRIGAHPSAAQHRAGLLWNQARDVPGRMDQYIRAAEQEGYAGIRHEGGALSGGVKHEVKIYWRPQRDIRIRPASPESSTYMGRRTSSVPPPTIDPSMYGDKR